MTKTVEASDTAGQPSLKRVVGRWMLLFFVVGDILGGAGIYVLVGKVAAYVGGVLWVRKPAVRWQGKRDRRNPHHAGQVTDESNPCL